MDIQLERKKKINYKILVLLLIPLFAVASIYVLLSTDHMVAIDKEQIITSEAVQGDFLVKVRGVGTFIPREINVISAGVSGTLVSISVHPGMGISANDTLFTLKNNNLLHSMETAKNMLAISKSKLDFEINEKEALLLKQELDELQANIDYRKTLMNYEALIELKKKSSISDIEFKQIELEKELLHRKWEKTLEYGKIINVSLESKITAAREEVNELKKAYLQAQESVGMLNVKSEKDGVLTELLVSLGQNVEQGYALAKYIDPNAMHIKVEVSESDINKVAVGQRADLRTHFSQFEGVVTDISPIAQEGLIRVFISLLKDKPEEARPDLSVEALIYSKDIPGVLFVRRPGNCAENSKCTVYLVDKEQKVARQIALTTGMSSEDIIEIKDGLRQGETIIVSDTSSYRQHQSIKIN